MTLTIDKMRDDIAALIYIPADEIGDDDNLADLGLDSMRLMTLVMGWEQAGLKADFSIFAEHSTLSAWWSEVQKRQ